MTIDLLTCYEVNKYRSFHDLLEVEIFRCDTGMLDENIPRGKLNRHAVDWCLGLLYILSCAFGNTIMFYELSELITIWKAKTSRTTPEMDPYWMCLPKKKLVTNLHVVYMGLDARKSVFGGR